jgi:hypothetical protein
MIGRKSYRELRSERNKNIVEGVKETAQAVIHTARAIRRFKKAVTR